ncbi:Uncharacterised protein [Mycobacterium tuberculosis]|nr:Uncharacterised protein [Mycobacterium tuberculosis]
MSVVHTSVIDGEDVVTVQLNNPDKELMQEMDVE